MDYISEKDINFKEKFLYHIWDAQHFSEEIKTISGKKIRVMYPGNFNTDSAGPDFKESVIQIEDDVFRGDVEIHLNSYDWEIHNHNVDRNYNEVVLHVVYKHNDKYPVTLAESGKKIEIFEIKNILDSNIKKLLSMYENREYKAKSRYCKFFSTFSGDDLEKKIIDLGMERFNKKIKRFGAELFFSDFNQLLYQGIFEALGYKKNKFNLLKLALKLPYKKLQEFKKNSISLDEFISIFLVSSDLINCFPKTFPQEKIFKWNEAYSRQDFFSETIDIDWNLFRIRPQNNPAIRVLQFIKILYNSLEIDLIKELIPLFSFPKNNFKFKRFKENFYDYFIKKFSFLPEKYHLGKGRVDIILVNIILPIISLYAEKMSYSDLKKTINEIYKNYPHLSRNHINTKMEKFMSERQIKLTRKKAIYQQGILKLYYDFCQYHICENCYQKGLSE